LDECGLPESTYAVLKCAAALWPDRIAVTVMPNADRWQQPSTRTFSQLLADVNTAAICSVTRVLDGAAQRYGRRREVLTRALTVTRRRLWLPFA
jgi:hypothetical protein